jgi:hypothetical protein
MGNTESLYKACKDCDYQSLAANASSLWAAREPSRLEEASEAVKPGLIRK